MISGDELEREKPLVNLKSLVEIQRIGGVKNFAIEQKYNQGFRIPFLKTEKLFQGNDR